jgi:hypothetical protein
LGFETLADFQSFVEGLMSGEYQVTDNYGIIIFDVFITRNDVNTKFIRSKNF